MRISKRIEMKFRYKIQSFVWFCIQFISLKEYTYFMKKKIIYRQSIPFHGSSSHRLLIMMFWVSIIVSEYDYFAELFCWDIVILRTYYLNIVARIWKWKGCSCKWFNVWHTRKPTVPIGPSASCAYMEGQKQRHHKPMTPPWYPMGISRWGTFGWGKWPTREKRPTGVKKPTGLAWLSLTSMNVYTWKCLVP